ncbi:MAG: hypothetical protein [Caudoviricetes sp.]|nr:MAG: hypothetical protein [Caudoviricetes sp.]
MKRTMTDFLLAWVLLTAAILAGLSLMALAASFVVYDWGIFQTIIWNQFPSVVRGVALTALFVTLIL